MKSTGEVLRERLYLGTPEPPDAFEDKSRERNHGVHTAITWVQLASGLWVRSFNGSTSKVDCGSEIVGAGAASISAWIYPIGWGEGNAGRIITNTKSKLTVYSTATCLAFASDGATLILSGIGSITLNTWQHVCVTRDATGAATNFYVNGVLSGAADRDSGTPVAGTANLFIGDHPSGTVAFDGYIADTTIKTYTMIPPEITAHYQGTLNLYGV